MRHRCGGSARLRPWRVAGTPAAERRRRPNAGARASAQHALRRPRWLRPAAWSRSSGPRCRPPTRLGRSQRAAIPAAGDDCRTVRCSSCTAGRRSRALAAEADWAPRTPPGPRRTGETRRTCGAPGGWRGLPTTTEEECGTCNS